MNASVVLVHSSGLGPTMWRAYFQAEQQGFKVHAPALVGYPPRVPVARGAHGLADDDLALVRSLVEEQPGPVHLVGHSYGGFLAARTALALPGKVASLALLEPVMFGALGLTDDGKRNPDILHFAANPWFLDEEKAGGEEWFHLFVDYWNHPGAWEALPAPSRNAFLAAGWKVFEEVRTVLTDAMPFDAYRFAMPTLLMGGERTTHGARAMVKALSVVNPSSTVVEIPGHGHMFPVTAWREVLPRLLAHWSAA